ncbi:MAG: HD-GYP domain-containing protein [Nitrospinota bacterium]
MQKDIGALTPDQVQALVGDEPEREIEEVGAPSTEPDPPQKMHLGSLRPIRLELIEGKLGLNFPIYTREESDGDVSLLVPKGSRLSPRLRQRIEAKHKGMVYIQAKDYAAYADETERTIERILSDESKGIQEKTPIFFSYATERLNDAFQRIAEEGGENVKLVQPVAEHALGLVQEDWRAAFSILKLAKAEPHTYAHSLNVCFFGLSFIHNYLPHYTDKELKEIALGFLGHDIGELLVSEKTLNKKMGLNPLERSVIQQVPIYGTRVLKEAGVDYPLTVDIVLNHHERVDGKGYPRGLPGHKIPVLARICTVCEAFDTMTTPQPYRKNTLTPFEAFRVMLHEKPGQFDLPVLTSFIRMMGGNPRREPD